MKNKFNILVFVFLVIIMFYLTQGCMQKPRPYGNDYDIHVVADSTIWNPVAPILRGIFEKIERTPQPENLFTIYKANLKTYKRFKNLIFISTLDANDEVSKGINSSLSENAKQQVEAGNIIFVRKEQWAKTQMVMFLIAKDIPTLLEKIQEQQAEIFLQFENYWLEFHKEILYQFKNQVDVEKHLLQTYAWTIRLPIDYRMEIQSARDKFVLFERKLPLRWLSVFWVEANDPSIITPEWCIEKRDEIGKLYFENSEVEQKYEPVISEEVIFLNRRALKLKGLWKNDEKVAGGPFRMYCFYDGPSERIYFIDMHLFSPDLKKSKLHYLRQMEIIAETFKTNLEITPEQLEERTEKKMK